MSMLESTNPATGELVGTVPVTATADIASIVAQAHAAQKAWQKLGLGGRAELLNQACKKLSDKAEELGELLTREMGKPLASAVGEVKSCSKVESTLASMREALKEQIFEDKRTTTVQYHDAFGVCASITPWNFPISMPHWMCLPALMAGNSVVLKPSEETPLIAQAYVDTLNELLPEGVLQVIHGADDQGKALVAADVDLIAFTGSRDVGKLIMAAAAPGLKRLVLELGGKDPMLVLRGADLAATGKFAANNSFSNSGQVCVSTERIYVNKVDADEFVDNLCAVAATKRVGNGMDAETTMGPMISSRQRDHVLAQIDAAIEAGAQLVYGGKGHHDNFVMPTVLRGVTHDMAIARDETFGPVACVIEVDSDEEAIDLANDTPFGLGATVFGPQEAAMAAGRRLTAGMIGVNKSCGGASDTPWVGAGQSGYGFHGGADGHKQFAQVRLVSTPRS